MFSLSSKSRIARDFREEFSVYQDHNGSLVYKMGEGYSEEQKTRIVLLMDHKRNLRIVEREFFDGKTFTSRGFVARYRPL